VAGEFEGDARRPEKEGGHWRARLVAIIVASSPTTTGRANVSHNGEVNVPRHVAQGREVSNSGEPIQGDRDTLGYGGRSKIVAGVHPWAIFLTPATLSICAERKSPWRHESGRMVAGGEISELAS
jgi:hypothetical protein